MKRIMAYGLLAGLLAGAGGRAEVPPPELPLPPEANLEEKARALEALLWERCRSPEDLIYCFVMRDTLRRVTQEDVAAVAPDPDALDEVDLLYVREPMTVRRVNGLPQYLMQGIPLEDVEAYEDSMRITATLLSALVFRYQATLEPAVLDRAGRVFDALYAIYELGLEEEPGWLPKPYGFRCTRQTSMDNQTEYFQALIRYYRIAPDADRERIRRVLTDLMDYWMRHRYRVHTTYFGIEVDYAADTFYPGHWPLLFLGLADAAWKITGEERYQREYEALLARLDIEAGRDPEHLRTEVRLLHRWYYQLDALLEQGAEPRELWLRGLRYQEAAMTGRSFERTHIFHRRLTPRSEENRAWVEQNMLSHTLDTYRYRWPAGYRVPATRAWRTDALYLITPAKWLERFWAGRVAGDW